MPDLRRFFRIDTAGPTWWTVSQSAAHAWKQWAEWHIMAGADEDAVQERPSMRELTEEEAAAVRVFDERDDARKTLATMEMGATICSEC